MPWPSTDNEVESRGKNHDDDEVDIGRFIIILMDLKKKGAKSQALPTEIERRKRKKSYRR